LQSHTQDVYGLWRKAPDPIKSYSKDPDAVDYNVFMTNDDFNGCEIIPMEVFALKVDDFRKNVMAGTLDLNTILRLKKDLAEFFIVKENKIYYRLMVRYINGSWSFSGYGPIFKTFSDSLSIPLLKEKKKVFSIYVPDAFSGTEFFVYKENNAIISFDYGGVRIPFIDQLKRNMNMK
jgi:hypothetical protein